jgi:tight adherence protein B
MDFFQTLLITLVIFAALVAGYALVTGSGVAKAQKRRMQAVRYRHSESLDAKVDAQFRRAIAARKPKTFKVVGWRSGSTAPARAGRLRNTSTPRLALRWQSAW